MSCSSNDCYKFAKIYNLARVYQKKGSFAKIRAFFILLFQFVHLYGTNFTIVFAELSVPRISIKNTNKNKGSFCPLVTWNTELPWGVVVAPKGNKKTPKNPNKFKDLTPLKN